MLRPGPERIRTLAGARGRGPGGRVDTQLPFFCAFVLFSSSRLPAGREREKSLDSVLVAAPAVGVWHVSRGFSFGEAEEALIDAGVTGAGPHAFPLLHQAEDISDARGEWCTTRGGLLPFQHRETVIKGLVRGKSHEGVPTHRPGAARIIFPEPNPPVHPPPRILGFSKQLLVLLIASASSGGV